MCSDGMSLAEVCRCAATASLYTASVLIIQSPAPLCIYIVIAYTVVVYIVMAYIAMAKTVMAYIVMANVVMAYIVMASVLTIQSSAPPCGMHQSRTERRTSMRMSMHGSAEMLQGTETLAITIAYLARVVYSHYSPRPI